MIRQFYNKLNSLTTIGQLIREMQSSGGTGIEEQLQFSLNPGLYHLALLVEGKVVQSEIVFVQ